MSDGPSSPGQNDSAPNEPLAPGTAVEGCTVEQVLFWGHRGGVYRVRTPAGSRLLKEILYPSALTSEQRAERGELLRQTVASWQALQHPLATPVERLTVQSDRCYLVLPELSGNRLSIQARLRAQPPTPHQATLWADQLASLVEALRQGQNPLAFELLQPDRILTDSQGKLTVFNPGWTEILWNDPKQLLQRPTQFGLNLYGQLLVSICTGDAGHPASANDLPHGLIWAVSRCLTTLSGSNYDSFTEIRQALKKLTVLGDESRNLRPLGSLPPVMGFILPTLAPLRRNPRRTVAGVSLLLATVAIVWLWLSWLEPKPPPRPALALAIQSHVYLYSDEASLHRRWRFPKAIQSMVASQDGSRLFVSLQGAASLWVLRPDSDERHSLEFPEILDQIHLSSDGSELMILFVSGRLLRLDLAKNQERAGAWLKTTPGSCAVLAVPLGQAADRPQPGLKVQGIVTLHAEFGLSLYDATSGRLLRFRPELGATSAILRYDGIILSATPDQTLHALTATLSQKSQQETPGKPGAVNLLMCPERAAFWSLQANVGGRSLVGFWPGLEAGCREQMSLPSASMKATVDHRSRLWVVSERHKLLLVEHTPLRFTEKATLPGTVQAMTFLSPNTGPRGLDRMLDQKPFPGPGY